MLPAFLVLGALRGARLRVLGVCLVVRGLLLAGTSSGVLVFFLRGGACLVWSWLCGVRSCLGFVMFFSLYCLLVWGLVVGFKFGVLFFVLRGLPPFVMFFLKWAVVVVVLGVSFG